MHLSLDMPRQPTDVSCGPTCLHAIYRFFGADSNLEQLIEDVPSLEDGGTLSVHLALHALARGFSARVISYNVRIFDPSWWNLDSSAMVAKLKQRIGHLKSKKLAKSHHAYVEFLEQGGELGFFDLNPESLKRLLAGGSPILTGLSATYLYREPRQDKHDKDDDVAGNPVGHFVVVTGWREEEQEVVVADPFGRNPFNPHGEYRVNVHRFINSVMLGIVTYDANLLVISPRPQTAGSR